VVKGSGLAPTSTQEGDVVSEPDTDQPTPELKALALFAEAIAHPDNRGKFSDPVSVLETALANNGGLEGLEPAVQAGLVDLLDGLSEEEVRMLARLQRRMVSLDPDGRLGLTEKVETNSHVTIGKL
jgi:hypothetical protein